MSLAYSRFRNPADRSGMTCEHCGAAMRLDRDRSLFLCDYCHAQAMPPVGDDGVLVLGPVQAKCPLCLIALAEALLDSYTLLYCGRCRGMLIAMDDLQPIVASIRSHRDAPAAFLAPRPESDASRRLPCPKCGVVMDAHPYGGGGNVNVDSCEACGSIWLDGAELRKIASAADHAAYT
jgi:Zn-finger nucleic acid-binding protein